MRLNEEQTKTLLGMIDKRLEELDVEIPEGAEGRDLAFEKLEACSGFLTFMRDMLDPECEFKDIFQKAFSEELEERDARREESLVSESNRRKS
jgi:hypothetical protein